MPPVDSRAPGPLGTVIRAFYDARHASSRTGDLSLLDPFIAADVRWCEPDVGAHMGVLEGRDAVLDMIRRALETTAGSLDLRVTSTVETATHVAAAVGWSAVKGNVASRARSSPCSKCAKGASFPPGFTRGTSPTTRRSGVKSTRTEGYGPCRRRSSPR